MYIILFYTPVLSFVLWVNTMSPGEKQDYGLETGEVNGNLANGFKVNYIRKQKNDRFFGLNHLEIKYDNPLSIFFKNRLDVSLFSIGMMHLKIPAELKSEAIKFDLPLKPNKLQTNTNPKPSFLLKYQAQIEKLEVKKVLLEIPEVNLSLPIDNWQLKNLSVKTGNVSIDSFQINSDSFFLEDSTGNLLQKGRPESFKGVLKKQYFSKLKSDAPFWGNIKIAEGNLSFYIEFFSGQLILKSSSDYKVHLILDDFNPKQFFINSPSIDNMNMDLVLGNTRRIDKKYLDLVYGNFEYQNNEYLIKPNLTIERIPSFIDPGDSYKVWLKANRSNKISNQIKLVFQFSPRELKNNKIFTIE